MKNADGDDIPPAEGFALIPDEGEDSAAVMARELIETCPEFMDLLVGEPRILFLMRFGVKVKAGRTVLGEMAVAQFQGTLAPLAAWLLADKLDGEFPDFICILDSIWWGLATPHQRRALVHHELKHIGHKLDREGEKKMDADGNPVWEIRAHDLEEFRDTVKRFGDFAGDVTPFIEAARQGGINT